VPGKWASGRICGLIVHWRTSGPSCISRALTANIGSYPFEPPRNKQPALSEWPTIRPELCLAPGHSPPLATTARIGASLTIN
jgi:hypothetical protein